MRSLSVILVSLLMAASMAGAAEPPAQGEVSSSEYCGVCHRDIHRMWKGSAHAQAMEKAGFLYSFRRTEIKVGKEAARACLSCHAPLAELTADWELEKKTSWEGVNCDTCHSLVAVEWSGPRPRMKLDVGPVKRGPIRDAESSGHDVAYNELHTQSVACAPCHEFIGAEGVPLMSTYSEWKESQAAQAGESCQSCHMDTTDADIVDPRVARVSHAEVNTHEVPGGHSPEQLNKALRISLQPKRSDRGLALTVKVVNRGAGHAVPTGMPGRRIVLSVELASADGVTQEQRRVYTKSYVDAEGDPVVSVMDHFAPGVVLVSDTRIKADEVREERLEFSTPGEGTLHLKVKLFYEHDPTGREDDRTWLTFYSERRTIPPV